MMIEEANAVIDCDCDVIDETPSTKVRTDLSSPRRVRLEMASVYRLVKDGLLPSHEGTRRIYMLQTINKAMFDELDRDRMKNFPLQPPHIEVRFEDPIELCCEEKLREKLDEINAELARREKEDVA